MSAINGYNIYNHGSRVYNDTQTQTQPTTTPAQTATTNNSKAVATPSQAEKISISDFGRAAAAQDKTAQTSSTTNSATTAAQNKDLDRFISGFTKSGHTKEQAINAYNLYASLANH